MTCLSCLGGGPAEAPSAAPKTEPIRIVSGPLFTPAPPGEIWIWIQTDRPAHLLCTLHAPAGEVIGRDGLVTRRDASNTGQVRMRLPSDSRCQVRLEDARSSGPGALVMASLGLRAPPAAGRSGRYTFAFGSCQHQKRFPRQPIFDAIVKERPDCFLFLGDNMYLPSSAAKFPADRAAVRALYREHYDAVRRVPELQALLTSTMSFAIWDDHDFGPNNSDRTWPWADVALDVMKEYFPNDYGSPAAQGCFYRFAWGDIDVFMLDDRTFRDPNRDPQRETFLGAKQLAWLKTGLTASQATFKVIVCGNQMLSDSHPHESWGNQFRPERDAFLRWLWYRKLRGVIFLAGDRHFAELVRKQDPQGRGTDLWELTSSPLANRHFVGAEMIPNPDRKAIYTGGVNYGLLRFDTTAQPPQVELLINDARGQTVIRQVVRLHE